MAARAFFTADLCEDERVATQSCLKTHLRFFLRCHVSEIFLAPDSEMSRIESDDSDRRTKIVFWGMLDLNVQNCGTFALLPLFDAACSYVYKHFCSRSPFGQVANSLMCWKVAAV